MAFPREKCTSVFQGGTATSLSLALSLSLLLLHATKNYIYIYIFPLSCTFGFSVTSDLRLVPRWKKPPLRSNRSSRSIDYSTRLVLRAESWISLCFPFTVTFLFLISILLPLLLIPYLFLFAFYLVVVFFPVSSSVLLFCFSWLLLARERKSCLKALQISLLERRS